MASTEKQKQAAIKWQKENMHRIPLDVYKSYYTDILKPTITKTGKTVGGWIKEAIAEKMEREDPSDKVVTVQIRTDDPDRYRQAAKDRDISLEDLIVQALEEYLKSY